MTHRVLAIVLPVATFALVCVAIEFVVARGFVADYILPPPSQVWAALGEPETDLWRGLWRTLSAALTGFAIAGVLGVAIAVLLAGWRWARLAFYPYAVFFQTVPIIAVAPMLVIWTDNQFQTVAAAAAIASIFPVIASTYAGLSSADPALIDLFRLYGAGPVQRMTALRLPWALPNLFVGLQVAAGLAVIGAMVGEFVGGGGLGEVIETARPQVRNDKVFAAVLLASLMGLALFLVVRATAWLTLRHWHAGERSM
ncbi:MAG TPA: ABC transporter permease subunit [Tepidisphaeraceae bacterium]